MEVILQEILPYLPQNTAKYLTSLLERELKELWEIRINSDRPLLLRSPSGRKVCFEIVHTKSDVESSFRKICASSAYSHRNELRGGFVTLPGGHRVGIVGTAVLGAESRVEGVRDVCGLTFRIAREYPTESAELFHRICRCDRISNLMLLGPPCSGKTTVLRDLVRKLSQTVQVAVVDEREELFPATRPVPYGCDVLRGYPKSVGILQSLRTLSPQVIVCDEIGTGEEVSAMMDGLRSGVSIVVSAHAYSPQEWFCRPPVRELFLAGGIDVAAFLDPKKVGKIHKISEREDLCAEMDGAGFDLSSLCGRGSNLCS